MNHDEALRQERTLFNKLNCSLSEKMDERDQAREELDALKTKILLTGPPKCVWGDCQETAVAEMCIKHNRIADRELDALRGVAEAARCVCKETYAGMLRSVTEARLRDALAAWEKVKT